MEGWIEWDKFEKRQFTGRSQERYRSCAGLKLKFRRSYAAEDTVEAKIVNRAKNNGNSLYAKVQIDGSNSKRNIAAASAARKGGDDLSGK